MAGIFAQEPLPDFDVPGRREPGERPELVGSHLAQRFKELIGVTPKRLARI
jgi:hypothetical protein